MCVSTSFLLLFGLRDKFVSELEVGKYVNTRWQYCVEVNNISSYVCIWMQIPVTSYFTNLRCISRAFNFLMCKILVLMIIMATSKGLFGEC